MIGLKLNSKIPCFPVNMLFRIPFMKGSGTNTNIDLCRRNKLLGSGDGRDHDGLRSHSLHWNTEMTPAFTAGALDYDKLRPNFRG